MTAPRPFPMSPPDSAWLRMEEPTNPMTITGVIVFGAPVTRDALAAWFGERVVPFDRFRMRVEGAETASPRWVPDERFDLDRHVRTVALPAPGGHAGLEALVSRLMSEPLDLGRAAWTVDLVEGVETDDGRAGSAAIVRLHHCIGDGLGLMHVLLSATDELFDPARARPPRPRVSARARLARTLRGAASEAADLLTHPRHLLGRLAAVGGGSKALAALLAMRPDSRTVFKGAATPDKRAAWTRAIPLADVRAIGHATGAKVNDVLLAAATGALRRYLESAGEPVDGVEVRAAIPFNVRPLERAHELGNSFGLVFLALPVRLAGLRERLAELKRRMDAVKASQEPAVTYAILQTIGRAPAWAHRQVVEMFAQKASLVMTNVPGPTTALTVAGAPVETLMFWVPQAGDIGLGLSILSLDGTVRVGVATDAAYVAEPARLARCFEEEVEALAAEYAPQAA